MFVTTKGIILSKTKYSDSSFIVKIYTEKFGVQSFLIKNGYSRKNHLSNALFSNLAILELIFDDRNLHKINFIKEADVIYHYKEIPFDIVRNAVFVFYNELFAKLLYYADDDPQLYQIIENSLIELDKEGIIRPDIHLLFLVKLLYHLGIIPQNNYTNTHCYFSIENALFESQYCKKETYLSKEASAYFSNIMDGKTDTIPAKNIRKELLAGLINYLMIHYEHIHQILSVEMMEEVLRKEEPSMRNSKIL